MATQGSVLVVNAGSSTLKLRLVNAADEVAASTDIETTPPHRNGDSGGGDAEQEKAITAFLHDAPPVAAVGHRVVHGGPDFRGPVRIDDGTRDRIAALTELAPLHQPQAVAGIDLLRRLLPDVPAVACFDTAFHAGLPPAAATYALPAAWRQRWGLRRYGFHGLSHAYVARRAAELVRQAGSVDLRVVSCHLGAGASLCAVRGGTSVDTTMGFTPLEGLVMATRSGSVDPGLLVWLMERQHLSPTDVSRALEHESGLAGLAGVPGGDQREVQRRAAAGDADAGLALAVQDHRLRAEIAAMAAALGGVDVLVFTGGVGEHAAPVRATAAAGLGFLGVAVDPAANEAAAGDAELTAEGARVRTFTVAAREDLEIARQTRECLGEGVG